MAATTSSSRSDSRMRARLYLVVAAVCILAAGACGGPGPSPGPIDTPSTPTVVALAIVNAPGTLVSGETLALIARATYSDGTTNTAQGVTWSTGAASVAAISNDGVLSALGAGTTEVRATFAGRSALEPLAVVAGAALSGVIHELAPTERSVIAGAAVTIVSDRFRGRIATTDGSGRFHLDGVLGLIRIQIARAGFRSITQDVTVGPEGSSIDVGLGPEEEIVTQTLTRQPGARPGQDRYEFPIHYSGTMTLHLQSWGSPYDAEWFIIEVRQAGRLVRSHNNCFSGWYSRGTPWCDSVSLDLPVAVDIPVTAGLIYEVRLRTAHDIIASYSIVVQRPS